jgi:hypothetical protein
MKNSNLRTSLFSLIILLSISSFAFLHTIEAPDANFDTSLEVEIENISTQETIMPDVKIVKTAVEFLKNMVPVPK